ncbi:ABC transporter permease [Nocardioides panacihumi]|uniref:ABC transporter permease n=1 Tax=Nocardioides panacihumi TaxID=400774 RepID=A0ABN2RUD0_9ACTN
MLIYGLRRLVVSVPIVFMSTFLVFVMVSLSGDPLANLKSRTPPVSPQVIAVEGRRLHLDHPLLERYAMWLGGIVRGDFGPSVAANERIGPEIVARLGVTLRLIAAAFVLALLLAVVAGVISALKQHTWWDHGLSFLAFVSLAMPSFWFAVLLKDGGVQLNAAFGRQIFSTVGERSVVAPDGVVPRSLDVLGHLVLPTLALAIVSFGAWSRYQRASMLDVLTSDYIRLARAKGLSRRRVIVRHALRNALIPLVTVTALDAAALLSGAVLVETVFQWRGMGDYLVVAIKRTDVYAVMAWLVIAATAVVVFNLVADLLYGMLDPRIRGERR